jgi:pyruvate dehydrogenase E1 component alpha subunit
MKHTKESLIAFEQKVVEAWEQGELPSLTHICSGNETHLLEIFQDIRPQDWIFTNHRAHYHCLLKGMSEEQLMENIRNDMSMFSYSRELKIYQSAILGGCCGIAVGVAKAIQESGKDEWVHCFVGDGGSENGALHSAAMYVEGHRLPCTFHLEDNDRQVDTSKLVRRGGGWSKVVAYEPPWPSCVWRYEYKSLYPHAGSGCSHQITFKRTTPL